MLHCTNSHVAAFSMLVLLVLSDSRLRSYPLPVCFPKNISDSSDCSQLNQCWRRPYLNVVRLHLTPTQHYRQQTKFTPLNVDFSLSWSLMSSCGL